MVAGGDAAEGDDRPPRAPGQRGPAERAQRGGTGMACGGEDRGEDNEVRPQTAGAGDAPAPMGGDGEQRRARAATGEKEGEQALGGAAVRQVQPGAEAEGGASLPGEDESQAALAGQQGEGLEERGGEVAREDGAARRQAPCRGAGVGQAAGIAEQPERGQAAVPGGSVLP